MKLRNKLLLSCVALAACATTMVSTTFAWYTSSKEVSASGVNAVSADSGSSLLLISTDDGNSAAKKWGTSVALNEDKTTLLPVEFKKHSSKEEYYLNPMDTKAPTQDNTTKTWVQYVVYVKNSSKVGETDHLNLSFTSINTSGATAKSIIGNNAKFIGLDSGTTYTVDLLRALCLEVEVAAVTGDKAAEHRTDVAYDLEGLKSTYSDSLNGKTAQTKPIDGTSTKGYNAHQYYNAIMEPDLPADASTKIDTTVITAPESKIDLGVMPLAGDSDNNYLKITLKFFINGWDLACFDAVQGQTFKAGLKFELVPSE